MRHQVALYLQLVNATLDARLLHLSVEILQPEWLLLEQHCLVERLTLLHKLSQSAVQSPLLLATGNILLDIVSTETFLNTLVLGAFALLAAVKILTLRLRLGGAGHQGVGLLIDMIEQQTRLPSWYSLDNKNIKTTLSMSPFFFTFRPNFLSSALSCGVSIRL